MTLPSPGRRVLVEGRRPVVRLSLVALGGVDARLVLRGSSTAGSPRAGELSWNGDGPFVVGGKAGRRRYWRQLICRRTMTGGSSSFGWGIAVYHWWVWPRHRRLAALSTSAVVGRDVGPSSLASALRSSAQGRQPVIRWWRLVLGQHFGSSRFVAPRHRHWRARRRARRHWQPSFCHWMWLVIRHWPAEARRRGRPHWQHVFVGGSPSLEAEIRARPEGGVKSARPRRGLADFHAARKSKDGGGGGAARGARSVARDPGRSAFGRHEGSGAKAVAWPGRLRRLEGGRGRSWRGR